MERGEGEIGRGEGSGGKKPRGGCGEGEGGKQKIGGGGSVGVCLWGGFGDKGKQQNTGVGG